MKNLISDNFREFFKQENCDPEAMAKRIAYIVEHPSVIDGLISGKLVTVRPDSIGRDYWRARLREIGKPVEQKPGKSAEIWHEVTYDQSLGLDKLIRLAVGEQSFKYINMEITQERFLLRGDGVRKVQCRVERYLDSETSEEAAKRLTDAGHVLGNTGDLAGYLHDYPFEVTKYNGPVLAISEDSRWTSDGCICVPGVSSACLGIHHFELRDFRRHLSPRYGVLVVSGE